MYLLLLAASALIVLAILSVVLDRTHLRRQGFKAVESAPVSILSRMETHLFSRTYKISSRRRNESTGEELFVLKKKLLSPIGAEMAILVYARDAAKESRMGILKRTVLVGGQPSPVVHRNDKEFVAYGKDEARVREILGDDELISLMRYKDLSLETLDGRAYVAQGKRTLQWMPRGKFLSDARALLAAAGI